MLREVGNLYSRSFRMIFQHPQIFFLSVGYALVNSAVRLLDVRIKAFESLGLICIMNWVWLAVDLILFVGFPLAIILMTIQIDSGSAPHGILQKSRQFFWGFFRQGLAGFLLTLLYSFPFACLVLYTVSLENSSFSLTIFPLWLFVSGFLGFGAVSLGQRILLDGGEGAFKNAVQGIRMLNGNFKFFFILYFVLVLIGLCFSAMRYGIGAAITGADLFSAQIFPLKEFWGVLYAATQTPIIRWIDFFYGVIFFPVNVIMPTLAYLYIKNQPVHIPPIRRKPITDN